MATRTFVLVLGIIYLFLGLCGFVPAFVAPPAGAPDLKITISYGFLFALFPVNALNNLLHLVLGIWGIASYTRVQTATFYSRAVTILLAVLAVSGLISPLNTVWGYMPIFGNNVWLNVVAAVSCLYFGFLIPSRTPTSPERPIFHS